MKKGLVFLLIMAFVFSALAEEKIHYGITGGLNMANLDLDNPLDDGDTDMKVGFNAGAMIDIDLLSMFSIQPELLLSLKGAKAVDDDYSISLALNYLEIPILAKLTPVSSEKMDISVFAGPFLAIKLDEKYTDSEGEELEADEDSYTGMDMGLTFGAALAVPFAGDSKIGLQAGYSMGVANIYDVPDDWPSLIAEPEAKTSNIFLSAIIFFN